MGRRMRRQLAMVLVLMLMSSDLAVIAEALATLNLPSALQIIEEEAFYGNTSIEKVVMPEGATKIETKAFADSSLKEINLPESIEYIADDAFDGCEDVKMTAEEDTYAHDWAVEKGFITPALIANPASDFEYTISDDEVTINWYVGTSTEVVIPSVIDSCPVTSIYASAFEDCTSLTSIIIPDSVTSIGYSAFAYCTSLTSVVLSNHLTSISEETFMGCKSLSSITIPSSVVSIGDWAFGYCTNLTRIELPSSVIDIGECVFNNCNSLSEISVDGSNTAYASEDGVLFSKDKSTLILYPAKRALNTYLIPQSVTCINEYAFEYCNTLISIEINGNDTSVGDYAFFGCSNLTNIKINGSLVSVGEAAFRNCDSLANITINGSIASIEEYAFEDCDSLANIVINGSIASIGNSAFYDCDAIVNINIPNSITSIGRNAFGSCSSLVSIKIHGSDATIGDSAFSSCTCLTSIELNGSFISTGKSSFEYCTNLTNIEINGDIGFIGEEAFYNCSSLRKIILPDGVTSIGKYAFGYCYSLMRIVIPDSVISIDSNAFWNCPNNYTIYGEVGSYVETYAGRHFVEYVYFNPDGDFDYSINNDEITIIRYAGLENEVIIPDTIANYPVTSIYDNAFSFCSATSITIPDGVTSIGFEAFFWCTSLTEINLPDSMISIGDDAFSCTDIKNITIPNGVISIGNHAFQSCGYLSSINIPASVTSIGKSTFASCGNLTSIIVDENNTAYSSIDGILFDRRKTELICYPEGKNADGYIIPNSVISIGDDAFSSHTELTSITIPDGVIHIGNSAFASCYDLASITLPDGVRSIGDSAFSNCNNLTSIVIPDGVTCINDYTFFDCSNLTSVSIPESIAKIGDGAFWRCWNLQNVEIPDGVTSIGKSAFYNCSDLTNLQIPQSVTSIGASAFYECRNLVCVVIPPSVTSIGDYAFLNCSSKLIIYGDVGSYAEAYAAEQGITFSTDDMPETDYGEKSAQLTVQVLSPDGTSVSGALIQVYTQNNNILMGEALTNGEGIAVIDELQLQRPYRIACSDGMFNYSDVYKTLSSTSSTVTVTANEPDYAYLLAGSGSYTVSENGGSVSIQITSSDNWTVSTDDEWISVAVASGQSGDLLEVSVAANEGTFRTGELSFAMGELTAKAYIQQAGTLGFRLPDPLITYPAADNDSVPFDSITVTWDAVEGAGSYVVSLRDLDTDTLLLHHHAMESETQAVLSTTYFDDNHSYRVAVGAVPPGAKSTDSCVSWCERVFTVQEEVDAEDAVFSGTVYEIYDTSATETAAYTLRAATQPDLSIKAAYQATVSIYWLNEDENTWEFLKEAQTDENGNYSISGFRSGDQYAFIIEEEGYSFIGHFEQLKYTAQPGQNLVADMYCYSDAIQDKVDAFKSVKGYSVSGLSNGLYAEYFVFEKKSKSPFVAANKRNEGVVNKIDFSWTGETVEPSKLISYYRLNGYKYGDADGNKTISVDYVPYKFAARFNGYIKLKGASDANALATYQFRLRGDDGIRLTMQMPLLEGMTQTRSFTADDWNNRGLSENVAVIDISDTSAGTVGYLNGTALKLTIEYYNKSDGGDANLIFEYSMDEGETWKTVPSNWLYMGERTVSVVSADDVMGVNYAAKLAKANKDLENYSDELFSNMLCDLVNDNVADVFKKSTVLFGDVQIADKQKLAGFWGQRLGNVASKAVYTAVLGEYCSINDEGTIWAKIQESLSDQFNDTFNFDTVYDTAGTGIMSIETLGEMCKAMRDELPSNVTYQNLQKAILDNIELYTIGDLNDLDSSQATAESGFVGLFAMEKAERESIENELTDGEVGLGPVVDVALKGMSLLDTLHGTDDANTHRAILNMMLGEDPSFFNTLVDAGIELTASTSAGDTSGLASQLLYAKYCAGDSTIDLNQLQNGVINSLFAQLQGANLQELLYKDLLKTTLDATYDYYTSYFKGL